MLGGVGVEKRWVNPIESPRYYKRWEVEAEGDENEHFITTPALKETNERRFLPLEIHALKFVNPSLWCLKPFVYPSAVNFSALLFQIFTPVDVSLTNQHFWKLSSTKINLSSQKFRFRDTKQGQDWS